jgi:ADP-ribose pyrophosphatase YjhB (NUDIX family)
MNEGLTPQKFSVRVYGILVNNANQILVSDEFIRGNFFTKFPGGGLELGEGTRDCLIREFKEETNLDVTIGEHIFTTDFYQQSAFNHQDQIISIYYYAHTKEPIELKTSTKAFDFLPHQIEDKTTCAESFRWVNWDDLNESTVHLPIDKIVVKMLKKI